MATLDKFGSEQRSIRLNLATYLTNAGWSDLEFSEGWDEIDITNPLINVYVIDDGKQNLEMGRTASSHHLHSRTVQIDCYMESEQRVRAICNDVMEHLDEVSAIIVDNFTTSGVGYYSFPDSENILSDFLPPAVNNPEILRWRGVVRGSYEAYYPNGGNPL